MGSTWLGVPMAGAGAGPQPTAQPPPGPRASSWPPRLFRAAGGQGESLCNPAFGLLPISLPTPDGNLEQVMTRETPRDIFQARTGCSMVQASPRPRPRWRKHYFLVLFFVARMTTGHPCGASSIPIPPCQGMWVQPAPLCKKSPFPQFLSSAEKKHTQRRLLCFSN